jgi:signal transduction histidine kinase/CheY-like chemotaxis protein
MEATTPWTQGGQAQDWLRSYLVVRQRQFLSRIGVATASGAVTWAAFGNSAVLIWCAHTALIVSENLLVRSRPIEQLLSRSGRRFMISLSTLQGVAFSAYAILAVLNGGVVGIGLAAMMLSGMTLLAVIISQGSRAAFLAAAVPATFCGVLILPGMLAMRGTPWPQIVTLAVAGSLQGLVSLGVWRLHERLLSAEANARADAERRREEAESATAAKGTFIAVVSHELRTPITAIQAGAAAVEKASPDPAVRSKAALIAQAGRMMRTLLDDLLDASKIEAGQMTVEATGFDLRALAADVARFWSVEARRKGLRFRLEGSAKVPRQVHGDPTRLRQIFNNLFSNALKFTDSGSVTLNFLVREDGLEFTVTDTGAGMTPEQVQGLFKPFAQADATVARTHGGTGLGLAISRDLAELMGGTLSVESAAGVGSHFRLWLPLTQDLEAIPAAATMELPPQSLNVLVVDDHDINRRAIALILEPLAIELAFASSGLQALQELAERAFDAVLMDVNMPGIDGRETTRRLRRTPGPNQCAPVIAITASTEPEDVRACLAAGMTAWVPKPIEPAVLFAALHAACAPRDEASVAADASKPPGSRPADPARHGQPPEELDGALAKAR